MNKSKFFKFASFLALGILLSGCSAASTSTFNKEINEIDELKCNNKAMQYGMLTFEFDEVRDVCLMSKGYLKTNHNFDLKDKSKETFTKDIKSCFFDAYKNTPSNFNTSDDMVAKRILSLQDMCMDSKGYNKLKEIVK